MVYVEGVGCCCRVLCLRFIVGEWGRLLLVMARLNEVPVVLCGDT